MDDSSYKKFTSRAIAGIKGEAFFEALISDYSIPHHIVGPKDIGIDYICEWVYGDEPTGLLYAVQIKTLSEQHVKLELRKEKEDNKLESYKISKKNILVIDEKTLHYWHGFGMPVYLFVMIYSNTEGKSGKIDCYYKRFTSVLTTGKKQDEEYFFKVNDGTTFLAFFDKVSRKNGFTRDLYIDLMRSLYYKGFISYISPRTLGLEEFPEQDAVIKPLFEDYEVQISETFDNTQAYINRYLDGEAIPSEGADGE